MNGIETLAEIFKEFPGIGSRQAKRFVYFLLQQNPAFIEELSTHISEIKKSVAQCADCYRFFYHAGGAHTQCDICASAKTDRKILLVVEKDVDLENIAKTDAYHGLYFVLGGSLPILEQNPAEKIRARALFDKAQTYAKNGLKEIILATAATPEGENTGMYVRKILAPLAEKYALRISTLGRGLSTGTELEYSDSNTLENALKNRS